MDCGREGRETCLCRSGCRYSWIAVIMMVVVEGTVMVNCKGDRDGDISVSQGRVICYCKGGGQVDGDRDGDEGSC